MLQFILAAAVVLIAVAYGYHRGRISNKAVTIGTLGGIAVGHISPEIMLETLKELKKQFTAITEEGFKVIEKEPSDESGKELIKITLQREYLKGKIEMIAELSLKGSEEMSDELKELTKEKVDLLKKALADVRNNNPVNKL